MNDPWDVKSVRQAGQYVSCMKINGVPLLPPVLSKECRKEMQYYKLLAREVEKRISHLKPYVVDSDTESSEDKTDAPELPECEQCYEVPQNEVQAGFNVTIDKVTAVTKEKLQQSSSKSPEPYIVSKDYYKKVSITNSGGSPSAAESPKKLVIDLSLSINETGRNVSHTRSPVNSQPLELPERDYECRKKSIKDDLCSPKSNATKSGAREIVNVRYSIEKDVLSDPFPDFPINQDGPSSLSSKSFTGSLIDIHTESMKEAQIAPKLIRQRSYTLLHPSPQLLAHLEVQSLNTGVEMSCISMSESLSNLSSPGKKRRSWDLESAKIKWSTMALELNQKNVGNVKKVNGVVRNNIKPTSTKSTSSPSKAKTVTQDKSRRSAVANKPVPKSEPVQRPAKKSLSPVRNVAFNRTIPKEPAPKTATPKKDHPKTGTKLISESEDPALRVRELYEKIQKQQLTQMASLVEKQKREQLLLQQVFEEQNNLLYKQLKTICPKAPIEMKEAWGDKNNETVERGPVSLSQLINHKPQPPCDFDSPVSDTLTETNNYINRCDDVLKRSKDITSSIQKQRPSRVQSANGPFTSSPQLNLEGTRTRTHSPAGKTASRRLNYDTSASSERECDPILTDRTNDTMADLNVTFPTDQSEDEQSFNVNNTVINQLYNNATVVQRSPSSISRLHSEEPTAPTTPTRQHRPHANGMFASQPTPEQRAAASRIVAYARGYLTRRLMATARVQGTVQTLRDALLCALQLHRERGGIRGADVDLHRRLIQQITAACYSLHDTFIASSAAERCALIAADRARRRSLAARPPPPRAARTDVMSQSHSGAFPARAKRPAPAPAPLMTQSNYETFSGAPWAGRGAGPLGGERVAAAVALTPAALLARTNTQLHNHSS